MATAVVPCRILVTGKRARRWFGSVVRRYFGDAGQSAEFWCSGCGDRWKEIRSDWPNRVCPNCYADAVYMTKAQVEFLDWGEQNGGIKERDSRWEAAKRKAQACWR